jgi:hypothetical protein
MTIYELRYERYAIESTYLQSSLTNELTICVGLILVQGDLQNFYRIKKLKGVTIAKQCTVNILMMMMI